MSWNPRHVKLLGNTRKFVRNYKNKESQRGLSEPISYPNKYLNGLNLGNDNNNDKLNKEIANITRSDYYARMPVIPQGPRIPSMRNLENKWSVSALSNRGKNLRLTRKPNREYKMQQYLINKINEIDESIQKTKDAVDKTIKYLRKYPHVKNTENGEKAINLVKKLITKSNELKLKKVDLEKKLKKIKERNSNTTRNFTNNNNTNLKLINITKDIRNHTRRS